ncbi:MAG: type II toxin-antitoxin system HicA family toxin [Chitinivibrionales bacterium]|nr:type II toxin-antitoxin system HicA family toxin [Chitinivibrionales bacterium]
MTKLKRVSGETVVNALKKMGFVEVSQRGSHIVMKKCTVETTVGCVVPMHKELALGTLHSILKQAQITADDFTAHL